MCPESDVAMREQKGNQSLKKYHLIINKNIKKKRFVLFKFQTPHNNHEMPIT